MPDHNIPTISIHPFHLSIADSQLADLRVRLRNPRWPSVQTEEGSWTHGVPLHIMKQVVDYWLNKYDWRRCEDWFNSRLQFKAHIDGEEIHFLHIESKCEGAKPLLLLHGWPGSVLEFKKVIESLIDPNSHGGREADAFHLIIPSLPGYRWSSQPKASGWGLRRTPDSFVVLMEEGLAYSGGWYAQEAIGELILSL
jgi:epoxide hydrolase